MMVPLHMSLLRSGGRVKLWPNFAPFPNRIAQLYLRIATARDDQVPRTRSSHKFATRSDANFGFKAALQG